MNSTKRETTRLRLTSTMHEAKGNLHLITRIDLRREDLFEALKLAGYKLLEDNDTVKLYALSENALPPQN